MLLIELFRLLTENASKQVAVALQDARFLGSEGRAFNMQACGPILKLKLMV